MAQDIFKKTFAVVFINVCLAALVPSSAYFCCFFLKKLLLCLYKRLLACFSCPTVRFFAVFF
jgi:hypothetical protein